MFRRLVRASGAGALGVGVFPENTFVINGISDYSYHFV